MSVRLRSVSQLLKRVEQLVAERVAVVEDAAALAGQEARAVDDVGAVLQEGADQARIVARVVLEVGVLEQDEVAGRLGDAAADGRPLPLVLPLLEQADRGPGARPRAGAGSRGCRPSSRRRRAAAPARGSRGADTASTRRTSSATRKRSL